MVVILCWGHHGRLGLLRVVWDGWTGPGTVGHPSRQSILAGIPWDQEWLSFLGGAVLLVLVPVLVIRFVLRHDLRRYGLGLPRDGRRRLAVASAAFLLVVGIPAFYLAAHHQGMRSTYPLFPDFTGLRGFIAYELGYVLFFLAIEFMFRGYLLFGWSNFRAGRATESIDGAAGRLAAAPWAIVVPMLAYTVWHLGKPLPEVAGTLVWGVAAGVSALATGTIWHLVIVHWLLNVFMDLVIWQQWFAW